MEVTLDDISLDLGSETLKIGVGIYKLTLTEVKVLHVFLNHREENLSREFLVERVWNTPYTEDTRLLQKPVNVLQQTLTYSKFWRILTIWGWGYRFSRCRRHE